MPVPAARPRIGRFTAVFGPGIVVMLADTDVGSVITAGQSGVHWGYRLLLIQGLLVPVLYIAQELTVRLGIFTGRGHGALICAEFGRVWGWVSVAGLAVATMGRCCRNSPALRQSANYTASHGSSPCRLRRAA